MTKSCALINYFNDEDMLKLQVASGQFDHYEKVYIFDGPYTYTESLKLTSTSQVRLADSEFGAALLQDSKYVYDWNVYPDERDKRIRAYNACDADVITLHDTDEFYSYNKDANNRFLASDKSVAFFYCQNLFLNGMLGYPKPVAKVEDLPWKAFAFRKALISAEDHLDHLWLVGVTQKPADLSKTFREPVACGYHFTQMRSRDGQRQKYLFYSSLYMSRHSDGLVRTVRNELSELAESHQAPMGAMRDIYLRGITGFTGSPDPSTNLILQQRVDGGEALESIMRIALDQRNKFMPDIYTLYKDWPAMLYVEADRFSDVSFMIEEGKLTIHGFVFKVGTADREEIKAFQCDKQGVKLAVPADAHGLLLSVQVIFDPAAGGRFNDVLIRATPRVH